MIKLRKFWRYIRWGKIKEITHAVDGGYASEVGYYDRFNRCIGYWAYGYWDLDMPYKGD